MWDANHENAGNKDCVYMARKGEIQVMNLNSTRPHNLGGVEQKKLPWKFAECDDPGVKKLFVCEKPVACPDQAYPCYYQPDNDLDWCNLLELTDPVCENNGFPAMPSFSVGYMYYLHRAYHGPSPASQMVTLSLPCDAAGARSYPITFFNSNMLLVDGVGRSFSLEGGWRDDQTPIGVKTPLTAKGEENCVTDYEQRHGICVNLRAEVKAAHLDRTMLEVTHCCGTADYSATMILKEQSKWSFQGKTGEDSKSGPQDRTCLTLGGMMRIFCDYLQEGIVPSGLNLGGLQTHDARQALAARWHATTAPFLADGDDSYPNYLTFSFLHSAEVCREFAAWETPYMVYDDQNVVEGGNYTSNARKATL
mmetsp:Transcript_15281/g.45703  ORF Transcript_15281/g.45703 Transcript_15281/m.45703 type:complete len:364 (+) Transcript_15281:685-1776(+)